MEKVYIAVYFTEYILMGTHLPPSTVITIVVVMTLLGTWCKSE